MTITEALQKLVNDGYEFADERNEVHHINDLLAAYREAIQEGKEIDHPVRAIETREDAHSGVEIYDARDNMPLWFVY